MVEVKELAELHERPVAATEDPGGDVAGGGHVAAAIPLAQPLGGDVEEGCGDSEDPAWLVSGGPDAPSLAFAKGVEDLERNGGRVRVMVRPLEDRRPS